MERQQSDHPKGGQGKSSQEVGREIFRTQNAFENSKVKEERFLRDYANPLSKTTVFIEAGKQKVESEAEMRKRLREK